MGCLLAWGLGEELRTSRHKTEACYETRFFKGPAQRKIDASVSGQGLEAGSCEHGNDHSGSIKCMGFLD
jgi:hypothetical protein